MKSPVVIYHANCWDGFCAAWLLWKCFPDATFHAAHYGTEPPPEAEDKTRRLFVVDFSYDRSTMFRLGAMRHRDFVMTVLDHHKTAEKSLGGLSEEMLTNNVGDCEVVFDMNKSGARLTWEWGCREQPMPMGSAAFFGYGRDGRACGPGNSPWLVDYTEARDLWRWELDWSREINAYIRSFPLDFGQWNEFAGIIPGSPKWDSCIDSGSSILRREQQIVDDHVRHAREIEMDGHKILAVNATVLFSEIAGTLAGGRSFGAAYFDRGDGKRQWSLRSRDDGVDVSEIAKMHGGGGHRNAAGFEEEK